MIKSKIFYKSMLMVCAIILVYTIALFLIVLPQVESRTQSLEEKNGREILNKVTMLTKNIQENLDIFEKNALRYHETELKNLTDSFWSIVQTKYEQSRSDNVGSILQERGENFKKNLILFYNENKNKMSQEELKQAIINYVNIFRYDHGSGYFFIHSKTTVVTHPIYPEFKGKDFAYIQDQQGVYFVQEFQNICEESGSGTLHYTWKHAKTKEFEDKVAYVFTFKPFDWIIGTSASVNVLQETLKEEVIYLTTKIRYDQDNYFFIIDYDNKIIGHPYIELGTDYSKELDSQGNLIVPPMVEVAREKGEGFTRYWWTKNPDKEETSEKLTYTRDFPHWKMVIGTGTYIDDIKQEVDKRKNELIEQLRQIMNKSTIGKSGYIFIVDSQAKMVVHPNEYMQGKDTGKMKNRTTGNFIFDDTKNAGHTGQPMYAKWDKPSDKGNYIYDKIFWVEYVPVFQWYIVASAYTSELQETSSQLKKSIFFLGGVILLLSLLVSFVFFRKLLQPISSLSSLASRVTQGDYSTRSPLQRNDELGVLSHEFNTMVDTIEDNILNLDKNVAQKAKEIEEQNVIFESLFYESSDGILLIQDGSFIDCNRAAYRMLHYDNKGELIALSPSEISPPVQADGRDSAEKAAEMISIAQKTGSSHFEWVHQKKDGSDTFLEVVLTRIVIKEKILIHVVWRDINQKKVAEQKLQKTLAEFSAVMDSIDYGILFMDETLHAIIVNRAFRDMWNVSDSFVARHPSFKELIEFNRYNNLYLVKDSEFEQYMDEREAAIRRGEIVPTVFERKDGTLLQYQCVVLPDGGRMLTYFDITELKNTQDQLARAQKMEAIGLMAGGVAHDLNNILSGIVSYPELLLLQLPESSELRKPIEAIQESGERAATVVADLLTVARGVASTREPHDINVLIHEYLHSPECAKLQSLHQGVVCTEQLDATRAIISCSPMHIKKTVMNLVTNAIEAVAQQGNVRIATTDMITDSDICKEVDIAPGRYVVLTIQDNGPGISANDISHIFEPFYSKKVMGRSGTGLGLTVVWNTVEDHGGQIRVKSNESGTRFTLYFPVSSRNIKQPEETQKGVIGTDREEHILVIDDELQLRDIATHILTSLGYRVKTVPSGEEAIAFIEGNPVDLIVIDMLMEPGINGRQTYEKILELYPEQKAIVVSGFAESEDVKATLKLGASGFIKKPYSIEQLGQAVKAAISS